jgi:transcriptional regulator with XRE-family HTH domain
MVGTDFKALRTKLGVTVNEVADAAGVTSQSIVQFERRSTPARIQTAERNVQALQTAFEARQERQAKVDAIMERLAN